MKWRCLVQTKCQTLSNEAPEISASLQTLYFKTLWGYFVTQVCKNMYEQRSQGVSLGHMAVPSPPSRTHIINWIQQRLHHLLTRQEQVRHHRAPSSHQEKLPQ